MARVMARGPKTSWPGSADFHVPLPRLQSTRMLTRPSVPNAIVDLDRLSGVATLSSMDWMRTSCHDVPARLVGGAWAPTSDTGAASSHAHSAEAIQVDLLFTTA